MTDDLHIVAVGARTPLGLTAESSMAAVRAGITQLSEHPFIIDRKSDLVRMAQDSRLDPALIGPQRLIEMAATALQEICDQIVAVQPVVHSTPLLLCLPEARPGWTGADVKAVVDGLKNKPWPIPFYPVEILSSGHAAGLMALDIACTRIRSGQAPLCVIAGVDSYMHPETIRWLDENRQLATAYHRGAFFPGEGAGAVLVTSDWIVQQSRYDSLAIIRGTATATEVNLIKTDSMCLGEGLTGCVRQALTPLRLPQDAVHGIICDINGERYRSEEWGFTMLRLPDSFVDPTGYEAPASCWGDVGAASGPLFITQAVIASRRGWAKGPRYLIWNSSEAGGRAAALLELTSEPQGERL